MKKTALQEKMHQNLLQKAKNRAASQKPSPKTHSATPASKGSQKVTPTTGKRNRQRLDTCWLPPEITREPEYTRAKFMHYALILRPGIADDLFRTAWEPFQKLAAVEYAPDTARGRVLPEHIISQDWPAFFRRGMPVYPDVNRIVAGEEYSNERFPAGYELQQNLTLAIHLWCRRWNLESKTHPLHMFSIIWNENHWIAEFAYQVLFHYWEARGLGNSLVHQLRRGQAAHTQKGRGQESEAEQREKSWYAIVQRLETQLLVKMTAQAEAVTAEAEASANNRPTATAVTKAHSALQITPPQRRGFGIELRKLLSQCLQGDSLQQCLDEIQPVIEKHFKQQKKDLETKSWHRPVKIDLTLIRHVIARRLPPLTSWEKLAEVDSEIYPERYSAVPRKKRAGVAKDAIQRQIRPVLEMLDLPLLPSINRRGRPSKSHDAES